MRLRVPLSSFERSNLSFLSALGLDFGLLQPTRTGLGKDYSDAVQPFRLFLLRNDVHDYAPQEYGREMGRSVPIIFVGSGGPVSVAGGGLLYRANKRGDRRIRITNLNHFFAPNELLVAVWRRGVMYIFNGSRSEFSQLNVLRTLPNEEPTSAFQEFLHGLLQTGTVADNGSSPSNVAAAGDFLESILPGGLVIERWSGKENDWGFPAMGILDPDELEFNSAPIRLVWHIRPASREVFLVLANSHKLELSSALRDANGAGHDPLFDRRRNAGKRKIESAGGGADGSDLVQVESYQLAALPPDEQLRADFSRLVGLYSHAVAARRFGRPGKADAGGGHYEVAYADFKPKDKGDYHVHMREAVVRRRGDRHEALLAQYAEHASTRGFKPSNVGVHPRDLILVGKNTEWLVEVKVVYAGDARSAVRASIGQLLEYAHFYYSDESRPFLMTLLSEPVGAAFVQLLEHVGIASVWRADKGWAGSESAQMAGLV